MTNRIGKTSTDILALGRGHLWCLLLVAGLIFATGLASWFWYRLEYQMPTHEVLVYCRDPGHRHLKTTNGWKMRDRFFSNYVQQLDESNITYMAIDVVEETVRKNGITKDLREKVNKIWWVRTDPDLLAFPQESRLAAIETLKQDRAACRKTITLRRENERVEFELVEPTCAEMRQIAFWRDREDQRKLPEFDMDCLARKKAEKSKAP
ncbi:hypothetical protein [Magnetospira sp. QH-2]|uniref:hypothetical protein n=1 Tax=Magnetospira sp. (strain QH-2) TaxID=1288970 RepID=UPI0003E817FD|nr:hypothetical protein [Magnetospira sp. QH-2]CCQ72328.1 protein of unknown function [Magnetospira sp. QH-2]